MGWSLFIVSTLVLGIVAFLTWLAIRWQPRLGGILAYAVGFTVRLGALAFYSIWVLSRAHLNSDQRQWFLMVFLVILVVIEAGQVIALVLVLGRKARGQRACQSNKGD